MTTANTVRANMRIVSPPRKCHTILRSSTTILHHARQGSARARPAPDRHRPDVRGGGVLCLSRYDREIPQSLHEHVASGVGALYRRVLVPVHRVESMDTARADADHAAAPADRAL